MRVSDLFARGQIDEDNPSGLSSEDRVRMAVLKSRGSDCISLLSQTVSMSFAVLRNKNI
jgi:hypothetical protein